MVISFTFEGKAKSVSCESGRYKLNYLCATAEKCSPYKSYFPPGRYRFEVNGAAGGAPDESSTEAGGSSNGTILLKTKTLLYFYIGSKGVCRYGTDPGNTTSVFGGGGSATVTHYKTNVACSGGGASDVRIEKDLLSHRVIVAGGSGGYGYESKVNKGGKGGGESGTKGEDGNTDHVHCVGGGPGTQISGGSSYWNDVGIFGYGGNKTSDNGGGGGGGWFGGGTSGGCQSGGGGGSGFVFVEENSLIELDSKYLLIEGKTGFGTNKGDGFIYIESLGGFFQKAVKVVRSSAISVGAKILSIFAICK